VKVHNRFYRALATVWAVSSIAATGLAGCGGGSGGWGDGTLTVFAASSLTDAFGTLARTFEERNPGVEVRQSFEPAA
jgi:molybdate transport system substrate-binding protein